MNLQASAVTPPAPMSAMAVLRYFLLTVWDPFRSDIGPGVNDLLQHAIRDADPARIARKRASAPEVARLYDEGYDPVMDPRQLEQLPEGSLGHEYARFIRGNGFHQIGDLLALRSPGNLVEYAAHRAYKLHDVLHVVLGCDTSTLGELRIVAFSLGQAEREVVRAPALALLVLLLHLTLRRPWRLPRALMLSWQWARLGRRTSPYTGFRIEDHMQRPTAEVRAMVLAT